MQINQLRKKQILELCKTLFEFYSEYLEEEELKLVSEISEAINIETNLKNYEKLLDPIVRKIWEMELASGEYKAISWNKYPYQVSKGPITFATLSKGDNIISFCDSTIGTEYKISFDAIIGACSRDGATLIENKQNEYTVGIIGNKAINSYNGATKLTTPIQLVQNRETGYRSNHNELILDTRYIQEISPYEKEDNIKNK